MPSRRIYSPGFYSSNGLLIKGMDNNKGLGWAMDLPDTTDLNVAADGKYYFGIKHVFVRWNWVQANPVAPVDTMVGHMRFSPNAFDYTGQSFRGPEPKPNFPSKALGVLFTKEFDNPVDFDQTGNKVWVVDRAAWLATSTQDKIWFALLPEVNSPTDVEYIAYIPGNINASGQTNILTASGAFDSIDYNNRSPNSYYDYVTAPNAPTNFTVDNIFTSTNTFKVELNWDAPSDNGGLPITGYYVTWSQDNFTNTNSMFVTGTSTTIELKNSNTYKFRVQAKNDLVSHFGTHGAYTEVSKLVTKSIADLDGWSLYGTVSGLTRTLTRKSPVWQANDVDTNITPLALPSGVALTVKSTATGTVTVPTDTIGIKRTVTGLEVGEVYKVIIGNTTEAFYPWLLSAVPANKYKIKVNTTTPTISGTYTPTQGHPGTGIFELSFIATATSHEIKIELAEAITATGTIEEIVYPAVSVEKTLNDAQFKVQDTVYAGSIAQHFDLVANSVGADWWVDKNQLVVFKREYDTQTSIATFSDVDPNDKTKEHYKDISTSTTTKNLINSIEVKNLGATIDAKKTSELEARDVSWIDEDLTSAGLYGFRSAKLDTNIYSPQANTNRVYNPRFDIDREYCFKLDSKTRHDIKRVKIEDVGKSTSHYLPTGAVGPNSSKYALSLTALVQNTEYRIAFGTDGEDGDNDSQKGFPIIPLGQFNIQGTTANPTYEASVYWRAGQGDSGSQYQSTIWIAWYDAKGDYLSSTTTGTTWQVNNGSWTKNSITASAPSGAYFAQVRTKVTSSNANNVDRVWYVTNASLTYSSFDYGGGTYDTFFDGNTEDTNTYVYSWEGEPGKSASSVYKNTLNTFTTDLLDKYSVLETQINDITWNALEDWIIAKTLDIGVFIDIEFQGTVAQYRVTGLEHDITPYSWMMKIHVEKV